MGAARGSWVPGADGSGFGIEHLPLGVVRPVGEGPRVAVRIGGFAFDVAEVAEAGLLEVRGLREEVLRAGNLNGFLGLGRPVWSGMRAAVVSLLGAGADWAQAVASLGERALRPLDSVEVLRPVAPGDYVDFYSSLHHATNLGRILRPGGEPLLPNWRHLPVGYHGRSGSIVVSGTPVRRPCGQRAPAGPGEGPSFGPERRLDFELELAFVTGAGPGGGPISADELGPEPRGRPICADELGPGPSGRPISADEAAPEPSGRPISADEAAEHIFGFLLLNDWSAREIQRWEAQPLGPFLGKSFATSVAGWVTPLEALAAHRVPGPVQEPDVLPYLCSAEHWAFDIELEVALIPAGAGSETVVARTNARELYWTAAQQLAHATSGGARVRPGDLFASGTISGAEPGSCGSLIELTENGTHPLAIGELTRMFLEDGDTVIMRGVAPGSGGRPRIELAEVRGQVAPVAS